MARLKKKTDNKIVAEWLIKHRWRNIADTTKQAMPGFVEDAVMASVYIVAGTTNGKVNLSPKLVFKCLMLKEISVDTVAPMCIAYTISERHTQRLAQATRFALEGIHRSIQAYEVTLPNVADEDWLMEKKFINDYYNNVESDLYSNDLAPLPNEILQLNRDGKYLEYGYAVKAFREGIYNV